MSTSCWGVVVAAGRGARFGGDRPKALLELGGRPLVVHSVRALREGGCDGIVVAAPADLVSVVAQLFPEPDVRTVGGGPSRRESVRVGLRAVPADARWVLIHDAARPLVPRTVVAAVRTALLDGACAVVPLLPVVDTIKSMSADGKITGTVERAGLRRAQTPQGFERDLLVRALDEIECSGQEVTDDAAAVAALGVAVHSVHGDERGLKITTPDDLILAHALLAADPTIS